MSRREVRITIDEDNRDRGKTFVIKEMSAVKAERWATQYQALLLGSGELQKIPPDALRLLEEAPDGAQGLAMILATGAGAGLLMAPLDVSLADWMKYVRYQHAPNQVPIDIEWDNDDMCVILEASTVTRLRGEFIKLHVGFFSPAKPSTSGSPSPKARRGFSPTRTSRQLSGASLPPALRATPSSTPTSE